jgi:hypothetical protein
VYGCLSVCLAKQWLAPAFSITAGKLHLKQVNPTAQNKVKHVNQQHKTQSKISKSNSTKHKVKHVNPTAQNTK